MSKVIPVVGGTIGIGHALRADYMATAPLHIPGKDGRPVKTELVIVRDPVGPEDGGVGTEKINWWHRPDDIRDDDVNFPHNHPWGFHSKVLHGGMTERRWIVGPDGRWTGETVDFTYVEGDEYTIGAEEFHMVVEIQPKTVTHMHCGTAKPGNAWGYLNLNTGLYEPAQKDPRFLERLQINNRWMLPPDPVVVKS